MGEHHARQRARERYNIKLTEEASATIKYKIATGDCVFIEALKYGNRNVYAIQYNGVWMRVVLAMETNTIITFLPVNLDMIYKISHMRKVNGKTAV